MALKVTSNIVFSRPMPMRRLNWELLKFQSVVYLKMSPDTQLQAFHFLDLILVNLAILRTAGWAIANGVHVPEVFHQTIFSHLVNSKTLNSSKETTALISTKTQIITHIKLLEEAPWTNLGKYYILESLTVFRKWAALKTSRKWLIQDGILSSIQVYRNSVTHKVFRKRF